MKKLPVILLFASDPGGANYISILANNLKNIYEVIFLATEHAYLQVKKLTPFIPVQLVKKSFPNANNHYLVEYLIHHNPAVVITDTSVRDYSSRALWLTCKSLTINSVAFLDHWTNYSERFLKHPHNCYLEINSGENKLVLPSSIVVMDLYAKSKMKKEGIPYNKIHAFGSLYLETLSSRKPKTHRPSKKKLKLLFVSEPITKAYGNKLGKLKYGYTEKSILIMLCEELQRRRTRHFLDFDLVIRPHPTESKYRYSFLIKRFKFTHISRIKNPIEDIETSDFVLGMLSSLLNESIAVDKPVASLTIPCTKQHSSYIYEIEGMRSVKYRHKLIKLLVTILEDRFQPMKLKLSKKSNSLNDVKSFIKKIVLNIDN